MATGCCGKGRRRSNSGGSSAAAQAAASRASQPPPSRDNELVLVLYTATNQQRHMVYSPNTSGHYMLRRGATDVEKALYESGELTHHSSCFFNTSRYQLSCNNLTLARPFILLH